MDLELPDGTVVQGIPDGLSKAEITNRLVKAGYGGSLASAEDRKMADPTGGMTGGQRFMAGWGKKLTDVGRGVQQRTGLGDQVALQADIDESRQRDRPLMRTAGGLAGNIAGGAVTFAPALAIPGVNTYAGAAALGAGQGFIEPVQTGGSVATNTLIGGAAGLAGQGLGNVIGRAIRPVQPAASAEREALVAGAQARGIPLTAGQATGSRPLQVTESVLENLPMSAAPQLAQRQAQQEAFNAAVGRTFGSNERALTPEVMGEARRRIGGQFTGLAARNTLQADDALLNGLAQIEQNAQRNLTPDVGRVVLNRVDDVLERVNNGQMSGTAYRNLDSELGRAARGTANGDLRNAIGELRGTLREAMDRSISAADQAAWQEARRQYANLMTVAPIAARNELGNVSGRTLLQAANTGNRNARFGAPSELAELGRIGRAFVADQVPNSGTAQRQFIQSLVTGGGGAGLGAGTAAATGNDPVTGAAYGLGIGGMSLLLPRIAQSVLSSDAMQRYLTRGIIALTPAERQALSAATTAIAPPLGILAAQQ